jgi:hypothetical protein
MPSPGRSRQGPSSWDDVENSDAGGHAVAAAIPIIPIELISTRAARTGLESDARPREEDWENDGPTRLGGHDGGPPADRIGLEESKDSHAIAGEILAVSLR